MLNRRRRSTGGNLSNNLFHSESQITEFDCYGGGTVGTPPLAYKFHNLVCELLFLLMLWLSFFTRSFVNTFKSSSPSGSSWIVNQTKNQGFFENYNFHKKNIDHRNRPWPWSRTCWQRCAFRSQWAWDTNCKAEGCAQKWFLDNRSDNHQLP